MATIPLSHPIRRGTGLVNELELRDIQVGNMLALDGHQAGSWGAALALLSSLTGVPELILRTIAPEDWPAIRVELAIAQARFTGSSRAVTAAVLALDLEADDFGELVSAWAQANGQKLDDVLQAIAEREASKNPRMETAERT